MQYVVKIYETDDTDLETEAIWETGIDSDSLPDRHVTVGIILNAALERSREEGVIWIYH